MNRLRDSQGRFFKKESIGSSKIQKPQKEKNPLTIEIKPNNKVKIQLSSQSTSSTTPFEIFEQFVKSYEIRCSNPPKSLEKPFKTYVTPWATKFLEEVMAKNIENNNTGGNNARNNRNTIVQRNTTFEFPIQPPGDNAPMKNIPHLALPIFRGSTYEDPNMFLFEFDVLCNSYDYQSDAQKLKLFPATLKDVALQWFMSLRDIRAWDQMKDAFLLKNQEYYKTKYGMKYFT